MWRFTRVAAVVAAIIAGTAAASWATVDVEVAISPSTAAPGDVVALFASVENTGAEFALVTLDIELLYNGTPVGVVRSRLPVGAGEVRSREVSFPLPFFTPAGTYTLRVTGTVPDGSDTSETTLEVIAPIASGGDPRELMPLARDLGESFGSDSGQRSWGELKAEFR